MSPLFPSRESVRHLLGQLLAIDLIALTAIANGQNVAPSLTESSPRDPYLSELGTILGASERPLELHLCFAGAQYLSDVQVAQGSVLAEALALRAGYRPLLVSYGPQLEPEKFNVLIGTVDQLRNLISGQDEKRISNGYISIQRVRANRSGIYLLVAGRTAEDLESTLLSLGVARKRLPDSSSSFIPELILPATPEFSRQHPLESEKTLTFAQLEDQGLTVNPLPDRGLTLALFFPGYLRTDSDAPITINFHLRATGPMLFHLNGREVPGNQSRVIPSAEGDSEYSMAIPVRFFQHGRNVLTINAAGSSRSGVGADELRLFTDSELITPEISRGSKLPDLQIVSQTFYPFIGQPDGSNLAILLPERDIETIDAAWTLLSRLAQSANSLLYAAQLTFDRYDSRRNILVVGTYSHLDSAFRRIVSFRAFDDANLNVPLADLNPISSGKNLKKLIEHLLGQDREPADALAGSGREARLSPSAIADRDFGIIATGKIPSIGSGWNLVVTASTQENLLHRVRDLVQPVFWDQIRGDIDRWKEVPNSFQAHVPGETRETAALVAVELPFGEKLDLRIWIGVIVGTLIVYVIVTARILARFDQAARLRQRRPE
jgi:hypothetical protein